MGGSLAPGTSVHVRVPASSANLGPGFDSIGLALGIWDECTATVTDEPGLVIEVDGQGAGEVPLDERHLVYRSMLTAWDHLDPADAVEVPPGLHLRCRNAVPHGRGLGSSATAIVTGIAAAQGLCHASRADDRPFDLAFTNDIASMVEGHPDNASASVYGGMTLSWSDDPGETAKAATTTVRVPLHPDVVPVVFIPSETLSTAKARSVLPSHVRLADAAYNSARAALLVHAMRHAPRAPALGDAGAAPPGGAPAVVPALHGARRPAAPRGARGRDLRRRSLGAGARDDVDGRGGAGPRRGRVGGARAGGARRGRHRPRGHNLSTVRGSLVTIRPDWVLH